MLFAILFAALCKIGYIETDWQKIFYISGVIAKWSPTLRENSPDLNFNQSFYF